MEIQPKPPITLATPLRPSAGQEGAYVRILRAMDDGLGALVQRGNGRPALITRTEMTTTVVQRAV